MIDDLFGLYACVVAGISVYFLALTLVNAAWLRLCTRRASVFDGAMVSVCVPARNEEENIERCVRSLMDQSYGSYEVLVLDDGSTDSTARILERLSAEFPGGRLRVISGRPLPPGWTGKVFAMHQLVREAAGEYLLLTDADTVHSRDSVAFAVSNLEAHRADMMSGYVSQRLETLGEQVTVPLMYMLTGFVLPLFLNRMTRLSVTSVAIGQYIMIRSSVLRSVGGYKAMRGMVSEDVCLARLVKGSGHKTVFADCRSAAECRMYGSYHESVRGISKNIFSFLSNRGAILIPAMAAVVLFLLMPFPLFVASAAFDLSGGGLTGLSLLLGTGVAAMFLVWLVVSVSQGLPPATAFLYPVLFANLAYMAFLSYSRSVSGEGFVWKGRVVH